MELAGGWSMYVRPLSRPAGLGSPLSLCAVANAAKYTLMERGCSLRIEAHQVMKLCMV
jgi:hypothetical protein